MWPFVLEACAWAAGATASSRLGRRLGPVLSLGAALAIAILLVVRRGPVGLVAAMAIVAVGVAAGHHVLAARDRVWRAALLPLGDPRQPPRWSGDERLTAPTAVTLYRLAEAVDAARRGRFADALEILPHVRGERLRDDERRLFEAVRAMVWLGLGDRDKAAGHARAALPTGNDGIDAQLGRLVLASAWNRDDAVALLDEGWAEAGVPLAGDGALARLRRLARVRIDEQAAFAVVPDEAEALAEEARAIGDDAFARELASRSRASATYR